MEDVTVRLVCVCMQDFEKERVELNRNVLTCNFNFERVNKEVSRKFKQDPGMKLMKCRERLQSRRDETNICRRSIFGSVEEEELTKTFIEIVGVARTTV